MHVFKNGSLCCSLQSQSFILTEPFSTLSIMTLSEGARPVVRCKHETSAAKGQNVALPPAHLLNCNFLSLSQLSLILASKKTNILPTSKLFATCNQPHVGAKCHLNFTHEILIESWSTNWFPTNKNPWNQHPTDGLGSEVDDCKESLEDSMIATI